MILRVPEVCLWPASTWNKLNFLRCTFGFGLVLKYCSNINETNWLKFPFYFIVLTVIVGSVIRMSFFICVLCFNLNFSHIALLRNGLHLDSETDLTINGLILEFFDAIWLFCCLRICTDWSLHELHWGGFFLTTSKLFDG